MTNKQLTGSLTGAAIGLAGILLGAAALQPAFAEHAIDKQVLAAAARLRDSAAEGTDAYDILASLTYEVGARLAGSEGDRRAVAWAKAMLAERDFENVRAEPVSVPRWQRGTLHVTLPDIDASPLVAVSLGGSVGTPDDGITAELLRVGSLAELIELDAAAVAGRIVFIDQRMERTRTGAGYAAAVGGRVRGASIAAERGALALVIRSVGTGSARVAHTGTMIYKAGVRRIPAIALAHQDADRLAWLLERRDALHMRIESTARSLDAVQSANVIGEIPGHGKSDQIIVLGAHLDSWDLGTGALDDGAGVAIVIKAAELIARQRPRIRRTVRVVLFANEEYGLSGAAQYRADHDAEIGQHVLALESDFGAGPVWRLSSRVPASDVAMIDQVAELLVPLGIERGGNEARGGADIGRLREAGVAVLAFDQDGSRYFDYHHTSDDTLDKVRRDELDQNVAAIASAVYAIAATEADIGRFPGAD